MNEENKNNKKPDELLSHIYSASAALEKWRIARMMHMKEYSLKEIASLTDIGDNLIEMPQEEYERAITSLKKIIQDGMWSDRLVIGLASLYEEGEPARASMENALCSTHQNMIESAKQEARLQIAYKMMYRDGTFFLDAIANTTELSIEEVECLLDIRRIRAMEQRSTLARVVTKAQQARIDKITIAEIIDVDVSELDDLIATKDDYEDVFDFSFFQKSQFITKDY